MIYKLIKLKLKKIIIKNNKYNKNTIKNTNKINNKISN
jgi:hypothetical protein